MSLIAVAAAITVVDPASRRRLTERTAPFQQATRDENPAAWCTRRRAP